MSSNGETGTSSREVSPTTENEHATQAASSGRPPEVKASERSTSGAESTGPNPLVGPKPYRRAEPSSAPSVEPPAREAAAPAQYQVNILAEPPRQEIRFALVMYGGVSLAIYIHGVAQELLRLARATSGADLGDDEAAKIYRKISTLVRDQDDPDRRCPTRFVIDILSGTSAGGINAIFLAKALAICSQNLENLRQTWLNVADMEQLLNTGGAFEPKRSLLKGDWMYEQLKQAFDAMNEQDLDSDKCYRPEKLDLFVTTTDLNGATVPIRLADMDVLEKVHKGCFNFRLDSIPLTSGTDLDQQLSNPARDDFQPDFDPMLAFAARCTSSFPVAFAPMKLVDIEPVIGKKTYDDRLPIYESFFRWVPPQSLYPQRCADLDRRELADGGYLDNKPFGHAIDAMTFRAAKLRHTRKLLYVDPFPEVAADEKCHAHFDFIENGLAAATTLPRYQTIREEIARVESSNLTQERLQLLRKMVNDNLNKSRGGKKEGEAFRKTLNETIVKADQENTRAAFQKTSVSELIEQFGPQYATYHQVRLIDVTSDLAHIVAATHETAASQDFFLAIRYLVRAWRRDTYQPGGEKGKRFENEFFTDFDYSFRLRRAARLLEWAQEHLPTACDSLIEQLSRILRMRDRLAVPDESLNPVWAAIQQAANKQNLNWDKIKAILEPITDDVRLAKAQEVYEDYKESLNAIAEAIKTQWKRVFDLNREQLAKLLAAHSSLYEQYKLFDFDDTTSLAFLEGSDVSEHTKTEVYRISPVDGIKRGSLAKKLAGYALLDFGAFLDEKWRENDMLWGRLDACERIVSAVLNDPRDKDDRDGYVRDLQQIIVQQEAARCKINLGPAVQTSDLPQYMESKYELPDPPPPAQSASQIAKATDILGRMIEEDVGVKNSATQKLRTLARVAVRVIALIEPRKLGRVFLNHWLALLVVMSVLNIVAGWVAGISGVERFGWFGLVGVILLTALASVFGDLLAKPSIAQHKLPRPIVRFVKWLPAVVVTVLAMIGGWYLWVNWQSFWVLVKTK
jgi:patatin-related protein